MMPAPSPRAVALLGALVLVVACEPSAPAAHGARSFPRGILLEDSAATSANVSVGDVNGDGHLDLVLVKGRHWPLEDRVLLGDGRGGFAPAYSLGGPPDRSYSGVLVDLDQDGDLDVVVSNDDPDAKVVHLNDGTGRFTVGSTFGDGDWPTRHVAVADLDGDSLLDAVLANRFGRAAGPSYICFGRAGGRFQDACIAFSVGSATTISVADVDGDGDPDLVVPHRDGGQSFIHLNDGHGGFTERRPFGPPDAAIRSAEAADLDGDGLVDLVVIDQRAGPAVLPGRPDGTWGPAEPMGAMDATPYALAVTDLDRNGRPDVVVGFVESPPVVFFNDGPGTFTPVPFGNGEGTVYGFAFGDLDEDGLLDVAVARSDARNVLYLGAQGEPAPR